MKKIYSIFIILAMLIFSGWNFDKAAKIITSAAKIENSGERIAYISKQFLGTPYEADTLIGGPNKPEQLVIDLDNVDCFTFLDYVEAMRLSDVPDDFVPNLKRVRYFDGDVEYVKRRHFFTDWVSGDHNTVRDVTPELPGAVTVEKYINRKSNSSNWLKSVPNTMRMVTYVPANKIDKDVIKMLKTGDYIGIYSDKHGLDVSHVGIFIRNKDGEFFRNASSIKMKVTDYPFEEYIKKIKGIVVFRAV